MGRGGETRGGRLRRCPWTLWAISCRVYDAMQALLRAIRAAGRPSRVGLASSLTDVSAAQIGAHGSSDQKECPSSYLLLMLLKLSAAGAPSSLFDVLPALSPCPCAGGEGDQLLKAGRRQMAMAARRTNY
jgi:hypothetical protein